MKNYALRLPEELHDQIKARAKKNGRSVNSEIVEILKSAGVPTIGRITADGNVNLDPAYARYLSGKDRTDPRD